MRLKSLLAVVAVAVLGLNALVASAEAPAFQAVSTDTAAWWQGQKTWLKWSNTSDDSLTTKTQPMHTMGINWGDGTIELFNVATDTTRSHLYETSGSFIVYLTGVNSSGTGLGHVHLTVQNSRTRYITASGTKMHLSPAMRRSYDQATISAASACRVKTWRGGLADVMSWPIAAGVPWTIPANYDSLAASTVAASDTVWVHVW